jgi:hypothetical protein
MQTVHVLGLDVLASRGSQDGSRSSSELPLCIPYTTSDLTRAALRAVAALTRNLGARVSVVAVQVVPFPLPLHRPAVSPTFFAQKLKSATRGIEVGVVDTRVVIARDREAAFHRAISPGSLVVLATKKRWWPTRQVELARSLASAGHSVALLEI